MDTPEVASSSEGTLSFGTRIVNVFSSPGEAFAGVTQNPKSSLWLIPLLVTLLISSVFAYVMFTDPVLSQQMRDAQMKTFQEQVDSGQMSQEQMDQIEEGMERMGSMMIAFAVIGIIIVVAVYFFVGALVLWLAGKVALKTPYGYTTYLSVYGVSAWVGVLGAILTILLMMAMQSLYATPSAALAVMGNYDITNTTHRILSKLDVFAAWQAVVIGIGMANINSKPVGTGVGVVVGLWLVWAIVTALLKFGM